jgi:hypothetical protein
MGRVKYKVSDVLHKFFGRMMGFQSGAFTLGHGAHEITIPFKIAATHLWISIDEDGEADGCGQIPVNTVGYLIGECSATFFVDVETDSTTVHWFAKL